MRLIDADRLEDVLVNDGFRYCGINEYHDGVANGFLRAIDDVKEAPTIDAEPVRHGKWNILEGMPTQCSLCGYYVKQKTFKYCPYCGAKMDKEEL